MLKNILSWILIFQLVVTSAASIAPAAGSELGVSTSLAASSENAASVEPNSSTPTALLSCPSQESCPALAAPAVDVDLLTQQYRRTYKKVKKYRWFLPMGF